MEKAKMVSCPYCRKKTVFSSENPFRPFCSERCRLLDLGDWASENYRVPSQEKGSIQDPLPGHDGENQED